MIRTPLLALLLAGALAAADAPTPEALAAESTAKCQATAVDKPTTDQIAAKVKEAVALFAKDGRASFAQFKGKDSPFIFAGTYIWIHDKDGVMLMHPILPKMEGKPLLGLKDKNGKLFFVEMNRLALEGSGGWVDYLWPKPGEKEGSLKVSYVESARHGDETVVIGCGVYDLEQAQVDAILKH